MAGYEKGHPLKAHGEDKTPGGMYSGCEASHERNDKAKDYRRLEHISHLIC